MAWTTPTNVTSGSTASSSKYNTEVVDNLLFLYGKISSAERFTSTTSSPDLTSATVVDWPSTTHTATIPSWATKAFVFTTVEFIVVTNTTSASINVDLNGVNGSDIDIGLPHLFGEPSSAGVEFHKGNASMFDQFDVTSIAGTSVTVKTEGLRNSGSGACRNARRTITLLYMP